ncbi:MAG: thiol:disulfide interchange protein [Rhizobiales bacterium]|nr:thiol:disulfide interchange protein [Hyphomicrobiales bacterium]
MSSRLARETGRASHRAESWITGARALVAGALALLGLLSLLALGASGAGAAADADAPPRRVAIDLVADGTEVAPGRPFWLAVRQRIDPGWHTYWSNPGDSGEPTRLEWSLPEGFSASDIHWPLPHAVPVGPLVNFGYKDEAVLLVEVTPAAGALPDRFTVSVQAEYLVCEEICIPEAGEAALEFRSRAGGGHVVEGGVPVAEASRILDTARRQLPTPLPWATAIEVGPETVALSVAATELDPGRITDLYFFPDRWGLISHPASQRLAWHEGGFRLTLARGDLKGEALDGLAGLLVVTERLAGPASAGAGETTARHGFTLSASANAAPLALGPARGPAAGSGYAAGGFIAMVEAVLLAVLGGVLLNLMPCVFPVLSLKALSLAGKAGHGTGERRRQALAYGAGVLATFAALGVLLLVLRAAGLALGWGFQFQSPFFVLAMAALFMALGLSLSGVFTVGGSLVGLGSGLAARPGLSGSFFTGVLASVASTPCTAPFMGAALGYALTRPAIEALVILLALGVGFALPIVALGFSSRLARLLPRPGAWMETLKQALAFPLYASVGWLVWVLSIQAGSEGVIAAAVVLVTVALAAWLHGRLGEAARVWRTAPVVLIAASLFAGATLVEGSGGELAGGPGAVVAGRPGGASTSGPLAEPYSSARLEALLAEGRPVFVNFTAAWCITCKVNELVALSSERVARAFADAGVVYLKGDWTRQDRAITEVLQRHGRAGVPLYLFFPRGSAGVPDVLPQILTEQMLLERIAASTAADGRLRLGKGPSTEQQE